MIKGPRWEMTEHGWHGVATLTGGTKWHAFVEHVDAPQHCTWAGTAFDSLRDAQEWCREEITRLREQNITVPISPPPLSAWEWLWSSLRENWVKNGLSSCVKNLRVVNKQKNCADQEKLRLAVGHRARLRRAQQDAVHQYLPVPDFPPQTCRYWQPTPL